MRKLILLLFLPFYLFAQQPGEKVVGETSAKIDQYLTQLAKERNYSGGLLILKNGETIFSKGYGWANREEKIPFTSATLGSMGSITKAFTAAGIL